jgi:WD40 repeat protein
MVGAGVARHRGPVTSVAEAPESRSLVTVGYDGAVAVFSLDTQQVELLGYHEHLNSIAIAP